MAAVDQQRESQADELYERFAKPLERYQWGRYVAISPAGETLLGDDLLQVLEQAARRFGPGNFVFKVGNRAVGKWR